MRDEMVGTGRNEHGDVSGSEGGSGLGVGGTGLSGFGAGSLLLLAVALIRIGTAAFLLTGVGGRDSALGGLLPSLMRRREKQRRARRDGGHIDVLVLSGLGLS
jgi:hypothetical protein